MIFIWSGAVGIIGAVMSRLFWEEGNSECHPLNSWLWLSPSHLEDTGIAGDSCAVPESALLCLSIRVWFWSLN